MATFWRFFACCIFSEPRAARFRPALCIYTGHTMCGCMVDIQSPTTEIRRGKKEERKKEETTG